MSVLIRSLWACTLTERTGLVSSRELLVLLNSELALANLPDYTPLNPPRSSKMCHKSQALPEVYSEEPLLEFSFNLHCIRL